MTRQRPQAVWEPNGRGWRQVRARIPGQARSARPSAPWVPRPPSYRFTSAGAEESHPAPAARSELAQLVGDHLVRELADVVVARAGRWAVAIAVGLLVFKARRKK